MAETIAKIKEVIVLSVEKKTTKRKAPPPFITSTLQKAASLQLGLAPEDTMRLAQQLFEKGLITYHRTDNPNLSAEAIGAIQAELSKLGLEAHKSKTPNRWKSKKGAQEAHEAIRPTNPAVLQTFLEEKVQKLYELIRLRVLASQLLEAKIETTKVVLVPLDEKQDINGITPTFIAKGTTLLYAGWRLLMDKDLAQEKEEEAPQILPSLKVKTVLEAIHLEVLALKTQAPKRYSEPALITKLEKEGIGRPSTYASILSNLKNRGYVQLKGKLFEAMPSAESIYDTLVGRFHFMEIDYTRAMESALDEIAEGKQEYLKLVAEVDQTLQESLKDIPKTPHSVAASL